MARYFHGGAAAMDPQRIADQIGIDDDDKERVKADIAKHHKLGKPHHDNLKVVDGKVMLKVPSMYWRRQMIQIGTPNGIQLVDSIDEESQLTPWEHGSITLSLPGVGFWVVPPGGYCDVPTEVSAKTIKELAPHLVTEAEALALGLAQSPAVPSKPTKTTKVQ